MNLRHGSTCRRRWWRRGIALVAGICVGLAGGDPPGAASVEEALEACRRFTPELLLLDVRLPGRDGLSAIPDFRVLVPTA
ncbi:MAG: hypothetical protein WCO99_15430, partial [Planctomycetota bacterium]